MSKLTHVLTVRLNDEQAATLKAEARVQGRSAGNVVRFWLNQIVGAQLRGDDRVMLGLRTLIDEEIEP